MELTMTAGTLVTAAVVVGGFVVLWVVSLFVRDEE